MQLKYDIKIPSSMYQEKKKSNPFLMKQIIWRFQLNSKIEIYVI